MRTGLMMVQSGQWRPAHVRVRHQEDVVLIDVLTEGIEDRPDRVERRKDVNRYRHVAREELDLCPVPVEDAARVVVVEREDWG